MSIKDLRGINSVNDLIQELHPYRDCEQFSKRFLVESLKDMNIYLDYPGRKLEKLEWAPRKKLLYKNLFDFVVTARYNGRIIKPSELTWDAYYQDFEKTKKASDVFWNCLLSIYENDNLEVPKHKLNGMDSTLFLATLRWVCRQEDLNYKHKWREIGSPIPYKIHNGLGRRQSLKGFHLIHSCGFTADEVRKR